MRTAYISHRECHRHDTGEGHPEDARRLSAIEDRFVASGLFDVLRYHDAPEASDEDLELHTEELRTRLLEAEREGFRRLSQEPDW